MKLADYLVSDKEQVVAPEVASITREQLCDAIYADVSSERIAKLGTLGHDQARKELTALVEQTLNVRGIEIQNAKARASLIDEALDIILGLGPLERYLKDPTITEIMVNGHDSLFVERDGVLHPCEESFASEEQLRLVVDRIVSPLGRRVDEQSPLVNARLPEGHRVNAVIPPITLGGTALTIRKFRDITFTLGELVENGTMPQPLAQLLSWAVRIRKNIAVSGGTGGGKTTLLNALSREISPEERIITIEDSAELRFDTHPHVVRMEARVSNAEGKGEVTIRDLVINSLRMRPDRIIVGECRGAEASDMLQAMNTGHEGSMTTLHANAPSEVVARLVMMARYGMDMPVEIIEGQIASALDLVVQQDRLPHGKRCVTHLVARSIRDGNGSTHMGSPFVDVVVRDRRTGAYRWLAEPDWVDDLPYLGIATREEVEEWRQSLR